MKGRLAEDVQLLIDLNSSREDNILHIRILVSKCIENHRGQREVLSKVSAENRCILAEFAKLEAERAVIEASIIETYRNADIDVNNRNILFNVLSKMQKIIKNYSSKLSIIFPKIADFMHSDTCEFQSDLRHMVLEKMSREKKVGQFIQPFQKSFSQRLKKEFTQFNNFYGFYGSLIDKRAQDNEQQFIKIQKYLELTCMQSVILAVKYYQSNLHKSKQRQNNSYKNLYCISQLDQSTIYNNFLSNQQGFCELFTQKMDRTFKQLQNRNITIDKIITKFSLQCKNHEIQTLRIRKNKQKKPMSNLKKFRTSTKNVSVRSVSEANQNICQFMKSNQLLSQQKPHVKQTLVEINVNDRMPLPSISHFKLAEFPATNFSFYKDKLNKAQLLSLFRKRFPIFLKENY